MTNKAPYMWRMPIYAPFTDALEPPEVDPVTETDMVSVCFNKAYLPFILGSLAVYTYDDAFNLTSSPEPVAVQRFYTLIGIFAAALEGCGMFDFDVRQNEENPCTLEKFVDGEWVEFANLRLCPPIIRLNLNFEIEISLDGGETFEVITDNPVPPIPEPSPGADALCVAAASAVVAFNETYKEVKRLFQDEVSVYTIAAAAISLIGTFIFFPPALPFVFSFFVELYAILSEITDDEFDSDTQEELKCILFSNGELVDGAAHFDHEEVIAQVHARWDVFDVNIWAAIEWLLYIVGSDGLDRAGSTGVVADAECEDCGNWCYTVNLRDESFDFESACFHFPSAACEAEWALGSGWSSSITEDDVFHFCIIEREIPECFLRKVVAVCVGEGKTNGCDTGIRATAHAFDSPVTAVQSGAGGTDEPIGVELIINDLCSFILLGGFTGGSAATVTGNPHIETITFYGTGFNPFGESNCEG